ncbi:MAG: glycosyltransferase family 2 protein [Gemmatimonadota bacterium]
MYQPAPFFSICIPQHNRTSFLIAALRSLERQTFRDFEVCISDDASTDGREAELRQYLERSRLKYEYVRQEQNLRYDGNLRAAIALARGRYCFLLGNDDGLTERGTLERLAALLRQQGEPNVVLTNYRDAASGRVFRRVASTGLLGSGVNAAVTHFRSFSFVSGVAIETRRAHEHATSRWDGSEMYQVYLVARTLAQGGRLLGCADIVIDKDLRVEGESVDSYAAGPRFDPCPIVPRKFNLSAFPAVVSDAIAPYAAPKELTNANARILQQLYAFTYPYWLLEFRRVQSWQYALGIALGQRPAELARGLRLSALARLRIRATFLLSSIAGLLAPIGATQRFIGPLAYRIAKRAR